MRDVLMRRIDPARNLARFYAIGVEQTLFGDWAVVRRWGRSGVQGWSMEAWFSDPFPAVACAHRYEAAKRRRGYRDTKC